MKITIIGTGNMGGAIASGLASQTSFESLKIHIFNRSYEKLAKLQIKHPNLIIEKSLNKSIEDSNLIIIAVKPWAVEEILKQLRFKSTQILASVAAGIDFNKMKAWVQGTSNLYRIIPNTAIKHQKSMTIISSYRKDAILDKQISTLFNTLGQTILLSEEKMAAATAISSCGIAYLFKYIQASMQAGIELGLTPQESILLTAQTAIGAGSVFIEDPLSHPSTEMDKVTTPGGLTIKGLNELEMQGFPNAIIQAIKKSL